MSSSTGAPIFSLRTLGAAAAIGCAGLALGSLRSGAFSLARPRGLEASVPHLNVDHDGDLLPDDLEALLTSNPWSADTDGDGEGDFVEAVSYRALNAKEPPAAARDGFRVILTTTRNTKTKDPTDRTLSIHILLRLASGRIQDLKGLALLLDLHGKVADVSDLLFRGLRQAVTRMDPKQGLLMRLTVALPLNPAVGKLGPLTFACYAGVGDRILKSAAVLLYTNQVFQTILPQGGRLNFVASGTDEVANPFWAKNRACVFSLDVQAIGRGGVLCEVKDAACRTAARLRCTASCSRMKGLTFYLPDGLSLITGG